MNVAVPDYVRFGVPSTVRMFRALTSYPAFDRLLELHLPTLMVLGSDDPLMPDSARVQEVAGQTDNHVLLVVIHGAATRSTSATRVSSPTSSGSSWATSRSPTTPTHPDTPSCTRSTGAPTCGEHADARRWVATRSSVQGQAMAFCLRASNSAWVMAPLSSRAFAEAI